MARTTPNIRELLRDELSGAGVAPDHLDRLLDLAEQHGRAAREAREGQTPREQQMRVREVLQAETSRFGIPPAVAARQVDALIEHGLLPSSPVERGARVEELETAIQRARAAIAFERYGNAEDVLAAAVGDINAVASEIAREQAGRVVEAADALARRLADDGRRTAAGAELRNAFKREVQYLALLAPAPVEGDARERAARAMVCAGSPGHERWDQITDAERARWTWLAGFALAAVGVETEAREPTGGEAPDAHMERICARGEFDPEQWERDSRIIDEYFAAQPLPDGVETHLIPHGQDQVAVLRQRIADFDDGQPVDAILVLAPASTNAPVFARVRAALAAPTGGRERVDYGLDEEEASEPWPRIRKMLEGIFGECDVVADRHLARLAAAADADRGTGGREARERIEAEIDYATCERNSDGEVATIHEFRVIGPGGWESRVLSEADTPRPEGGDDAAT